jgi:dGTPase
MVRELKDFLYKHMYRHYRVVRMAQKAERFITELFKAYVQEPNMLPDATQLRLVEADGQPRERIVTDYIAGMTDRYALQEYQRLFDPFMKP